MKVPTLVDNITTHCSHISLSLQALNFVNYSFKHVFVKQLTLKYCKALQQNT